MKIAMDMVLIKKGVEGNCKGIVKLFQTFSFLFHYKTTDSWGGFVFRYFKNRCIVAHPNLSSEKTASDIYLVQTQPERIACDNIALHKTVR